MNRIGMIVDFSHTGYKTTMQAIEASEAPVILSHSNSCKLWDHERNISDELIKATAETGGFVGVTGVAKFLGPGGAKIAHLVEHIDHMLELVDPDHMAVSMDSVLLKKGKDAPFYAIGNTGPNLSTRTAASKTIFDRKISHASPRPCSIRGTKRLASLVSWGRTTSISPQPFGSKVSIVLIG
jgi:hypothetical protein